MKLQFLFLIALLISGIYSNIFVYKHPQGSPSEFNSYLNPTPEQTATTSGAATYDIELSDVNGKHIWKSEVAVDSEEKLTISILSPIYEHFEVQIMQPNSKLVNIHQMAKELVQDFGIDGATFPAHSFEFVNPVKGVWQIMITCSGNAITELTKKRGVSSLPQGRVIVGNYSPYKISAHLASLDTIQDETVGFELRLVDDSKTKTSFLHDPIVGAKIRVELEVIEPNGKEIDVEMHDDGVLGDRVANDGIYYAQIKADQTGRYLSQIIVNGEDPEGNPFTRTDEIAFNVVTDNIDIKSAVGQYDDSNKVLDVYLEVEETSLMKSADAKRFKVWAQVWGENSKQEMVPVSWVSGFVEVSSNNGKYFLGRIEINHRWLAAVDVSSNLQLRNLRVRDSDWSVIIENIPSLDIQINQIPDLRVSQMDEPLDVITYSMKYGWEADKYLKENMPKSSSAAYKFQLILVHGYCAQSNPFPIADFSNAIHFNGALRESLSNDEFSRRVITFMISTNALNASSLIAHSQGGMVSTHTYNYYVTPLDVGLETKQRIIQTVGTPYRGSSLAGSVAGLGQIFGVGCGSNNDLTHAGADSWLADIAVSTRNLVNFYFTQYATGGLINSCSVAANLVLSWPNDGTTEVDYASMPNGNNQQGNPVKGWCHTTDMNHPPQCTDKSRNTQMNNFANTDKF